MGQPLFYGSGANFMPAYPQMPAYAQAQGMGAPGMYGQGAVQYPQQHHQAHHHMAGAFQHGQGGKHYPGQGKGATGYGDFQMPGGAYAFGAPAYPPSTGSSMPAMQPSLGSMQGYPSGYDAGYTANQPASYGGYDMLGADFHAQQHMYMQGGPAGMYPPSCT